MAKVRMSRRLLTCPLKNFYTRPFRPSTSRRVNAVVATPKSCNDSENKYAHWVSVTLRAPRTFFPRSGYTTQASWSQHLEITHLKPSRSRAWSKWIQNRGSMMAPHLSLCVCLWGIGHWDNSVFLLLVERRVSHSVMEKREVPEQKQTKSLWAYGT